MPQCINRPQWVKQYLQFLWGSFYRWKHIGWNCADDTVNIAYHNTFVSLQGNISIWNKILLKSFPNGLMHSIDYTPSMMTSWHGNTFHITDLLWRKSTGQISASIMTSSNGNIFRVTGPLCGEFTGHRWIPLTKASKVVLWCFLWSAPEQMVEQTRETLVIWNAIVLIMTSL